MTRCLLLLCLIVPLAAAQDLVFTGTPSVRIDADGHESIKVELSDQGSKKYECQITRKGKRYYWVSRGNRELIRANAGDFVYFISPEGSGYIKIHVGAGKEPYSYMEHLTSGFKNMTYWGSSSGLKQ